MPPVMEVLREGPGVETSGRRWPVSIEGLMNLLATWDACTAPDPLAAPPDERARRRRELVALRRDDPEREHDRRRKRSRRQREQLERVVLAARLVGAAT
ncbi:MAG: hypothetical protein M9894_17100 [Planctomycetes bacterium]|nr:hypothetical protein [Planctomycetota bacterium]